MPKITIVGGGSYTWSPLFLRDIVVESQLAGSTITLHDVDPQPLDLVHALGQKVVDACSGDHVLEKTLDLDEALSGADFVILTISTGGLEAMQHDLEIAEKYGIYQSVGDTVGPSGLARGLRNIPIVVDIARRLQALCPNAWLLNYTNPMTILCRAVTQQTNIRTIGLCHEFRGVCWHLAALFGVDEADIQASVGGINHLPWILDLKVQGQDGMSRFGEMAERILAGELVVDEGEDSSFADHFKVKSRLFQIFGALPAAGDRHVAEFFPYFLSDNAGRGQAYGVQRTPVTERLALRDRDRRFIEALLYGEVDLTPYLAQASSEAAVEIICALSGSQPYTGPLNLPNEGQIPNLPLGVVVETLGVVDVTGVHPISPGPLPAGVASVVRTHVDNQEMIVAAALGCDRSLALRALANDPMVQDLAGVEAMLDEFLDANRQYAPLASERIC